MSIKCFYRVSCSGCGRFLDAEGNSVCLPENALQFETWAEANEYTAKKAQWFDGHNGEYAHCTCGRWPEGSRLRERTAVGTHDMKCRVMQPRCVPLCPPCREACSD